MRYSQIPVLTINDALHLNELGEVIWSDRPVSHFASISAYKRYNTLFKGKEFGYISGKYRQGTIVVGGKNRRLLYHVAKWVIAKGDYPKGVIDHIDGNGLNNELSNLRDVSRVVNSRNAKMRSDNKTGVNGVHYATRESKYIAQGYETIDGVLKNVYLGSYNNLEDAAIVRASWENSIGCSDRHGRK